MKKYLKLFLTFFKIGLFTFGGGYAMISLIHKETVEKNNWISQEDMNNIIVVAESTPGAISINAATYIGYKVGKFLGALVAILGLILPSLIIIICISILLDVYKEATIINYAFNGIRASIIILMVEAILKLSKPLNKNAFFYSLIICSFALNFFLKVNAILLIIVGILIGAIKELYSSKKVSNLA